MDWNDLKIFLHVARLQKLDRASAKSNIDPTTISRRLKRLEATVGSTLFERTRRGHILTPAGEALADRAEAMESVAFDIASDQISEKSAAGRIRLGAPEGLGITHIAPALSQFRRQHPNIDVDLIALSGFVSVPKREADMSVLLTRPNTGRLKIRRLTDYSLGLFGASSQLGEMTDSFTFEDIRKHTLIGYVDDLIYSNQLRYFEEITLGRVPDLCSTSINAQLAMISAGAGIGILPHFMALRQPNLVHLLSSEIKITRTFWLAIHEDVANLKRNQLMSNFLAKTLKSLP